MTDFVSTDPIPMSPHGLATPYDSGTSESGVFGLWSSWRRAQNQTTMFEYLTRLRRFPWRRSDNFSLARGDVQKI
jgi:hypothetical protein